MQSEATPHAFPIIVPVLLQSNTGNELGTTHSDQILFPCRYNCGKSFAQSGLRLIHERTHTGERPFQCRYCVKKFISLSDCRKHERRHPAQMRQLKPKPSCIDDKMVIHEAKTTDPEVGIHVAGIQLKPSAEIYQLDFEAKVSHDELSNVQDHENACKQLCPEVEVHQTVHLNKYSSDLTASHSQSRYWKYPHKHSDQPLSSFFYIKQEEGSDTDNCSGNKQEEGSDIGLCSGVKQEDVNDNDSGSGIKQDELNDNDYCSGIKQEELNGNDSCSGVEMKDVWDVGSCSGSKQEQDTVNDSYSRLNTITVCKPGTAQIERDQKPFQCRYCGKKFKLSQNCRAHERLHTGEKPYQCRYCEQKFTRLGSRRTHEIQHTGEKPYQCRYCEKKFTRLDNCRTHERIHTGEKPYQCCYCGKNFNELGGCRKHERIHTGEKPYQCCYCGKKFNELRSFRTHERTHTGEKPYQCRYCEKKFNESGNCRQHERTHTGEKPYQCRYCAMKFTNSLHFRSHERIHTGEKPYQCRYCKKYFRVSESCRTHEVTHTGERRYQCSYCEKKFLRRMTCRRHEKIHTGEKPYPCSYCEKKFAELGDCRTHERRHTGEKPYSCNYCEKKFVRMAECRTHEKKHSGLVEEKNVRLRFDKVAHRNAHDGDLECAGNASTNNASKVPTKAHDPGKFCSEREVHEQGALVHKPSSATVHSYRDSSDTADSPNQSHSRDFNTPIRLSNHPESAFLCVKLEKLCYTDYSSGVKLETGGI